MSLFFFVLSFILGAIATAMMGVSLVQYVLAIVAVLVVLTLVRVLIGYQ